MKRTLLLGVGLLFTAALIAAAASQAFDLSWWTVDGGGLTVSSGGDYTLGGTIGQPDAGHSTGGAYTLSGGFWVARALVEPIYGIYLPLVQRE